MSFSMLMAQKPFLPAIPVITYLDFWQVLPTIQVPLRSESTDGSVEVVEDGNGYHTATIG